MSISPTETPDSSLLQLAQQGNLKARGQIVEIYQLQIRTFVASLSGNLHYADDLAQEVFLRLLDRLDKIESPEKILPFLKGISRNVVKEFFKKEKVQTKHKLRWMEICEQFELDTLNASNHNETDKLESLSLCLGSLPEKSKNLLELRYHQCMNSQEIAAHLKLKSAAVRKSFSRLHVKLLDCVQQKLSHITP